MMRSLFSGVSGLQAHQTRMDVISNNIANVNTNGFKYGRVTFAETFAQTIKSSVSPNGQSGGSNPQQVGLGVQIASIDTIVSQGSISQTGRATDLAIQGNGYFVLSDKLGSGARAYGRDGNFVIDGEGYLVTASGGNVVQGWQADKGGTINNATPLQNVRMPINASIEAKATTDFKIGGNFASPGQLAEGNAAANLFTPPVAPAAAIPNNTTLTAGELQINDISITGSFGTGVATNQLSDLRKLADLVNAKTSLTNVFASVKSTSAGNQLVLTSNKIGPLSAIKITAAPVGAANTGTLAALGYAPGVYNTTIYTKTTAAQAVAVPAGARTLVSGDMIINGVDLGPMPTTSATNTAEQNAQEVAGLINAKTSLHGVSAETDGAGKVLLKAAARDIILSGTANGTTVSGLDMQTNTDNLARTATTIAGTSFDMYDAQGAKHVMNINYAADYNATVDAGGNVVGTNLKGEWRWAGFSSDSGMLVNSQDSNGNQSDHLITFDNKGVLKGFSSGSLTTSYINSNATPPKQTMKINAGTIGTTAGVTQFGGLTSVDGAGQNGYASGELVNFGIERNGTLTGIYTNGVTVPIAQLAMATFANPEGLYRSGDTSQVRGASNAFSESPNSGPPRVGIANSGNRGEIRGGSLELSNVDLSQQFTDMIITQRGFQANSKSITTSDEMLQELMNLKRKRLTRQSGRR
ncbi:MAG: flagellar hook-basal body complex protein [Candidatus Sericytochromatia bacterium]|nr:flagellar hook-basal body complex protein [Candidatus Sericytochromatia bacterium]